VAFRSGTKGESCPYAYELGARVGVERGGDYKALAHLDLNAQAEMNSGAHTDGPAPTTTARGHCELTGEPKGVEVANRLAVVPVGGEGPSGPM